MVPSNVHTEFGCCSGNLGEMDGSRPSSRHRSRAVHQYCGKDRQDQTPPT